LTFSNGTKTQQKTKNNKFLFTLVLQMSSAANGTKVGVGEGGHQGGGGNVVG